VDTTPKITVITRTKDRPRLLARVAKGLELQSYNDFEWLIINDGGDDSLKDRALEKLAEALDEAPDCVGAICGYELNDLAFANTLLTISTLFRRDAAIKAGGMTLTLDALEDWDLWLRLMLEGDFVLVKDALAYQHLRAPTHDAYAQSAKAEHDTARIRLLNHYLREDIKSGKQGLGHLMNVQNRQTIEELSALTGSLRKIKRRLMFWRR